MTLRIHMQKRTFITTAAVALLYLTLVVSWFFAITNSRSRWNTARTRHRQAQKALQSEQALLSNFNVFSELYRKERQKIPLVSNKASTDVDCLMKMETVARDNNVILASRQPLAERMNDYINELPIEVKVWECDLDPLVKFLNGLECADGTRFGIEFLSIRPGNAKGSYMCNLTITGAYMRATE